MANTIITKNSATASAVPTSGDLVQGELAVNVTDKRLFTENSGGTVVELGTNPSSLTAPNITDNATTATLKYSGAAKLATTSTGIDVTGLTDTDTLNVSGNVTLGDASTDTVTVNGYMGVGGSASSSYGINLTPSALTGTTQRGLSSSIIGTSAATSSITGVRGSVETAAASFTVSDAIALLAAGGGKGAGSTITNQHGVYVADQAYGTNNYGITSAVSSGTNKWNIYASGTAANYFAGNVGIGTSTTTNGRLNVQAGTAATGNSAFFSNPDGTYNPYLQIQHSSDGVKLFNGSSYGAASNNLIFGNAGTSETMRLDSAGNLGLGVTPSGWSASFKSLDIQTNGASVTSTGTADARFYSNAYYNGTAWTYKGGSYAAGYQQSNSDHKWFTAPSGTAGNAITFTQAMTLTSGGYLGIGTTSPTVGLQVDTGSDSRIRLSNSGTVVGQLQATSSAFSVSAIGASVPLTVLTNGTERLRLDAAGNLGLGVTPSAWTTLSSVLQIKQASLVSESNDQLYLSANGYYSSGVWKYIASDTATQYYQAAGAHVWRTAPSGTAGGTITFSQAMTLDASGRLLLGRTSQTGSLRLQVEAQSGFSLSAGFHSPSTQSTIEFKDSTTTADYKVRIGSEGDNLLLFAGGTERARIDSSGNLLVGTTSKLNLGKISLLINAASGERGYTTQPTTAVSYVAADFRSSTSVSLGGINCTTTATAYNTSSDYRLKEDWQPMTGASERVKALKPVNFAWKADGSRVDGFLAHEAQAVVPEAVTGEKDAVDAEGNPEYQGIDQSKLVPLLTAALQEALAKIESLEARLDAANL